MRPDQARLRIHRLVATNYSGLAQFPSERVIPARGPQHVRVCMSVCNIHQRHDTLRPVRAGACSGRKTAQWLEHPRFRWRTYGPRYANARANDISQSRPPRPKAPAAGWQDVRATTIDDFFVAHNLSRVDHLKIDAEGWDPLVLQGARRVLQAARVRLVEFECAPALFFRRLMAAVPPGGNEPVGEHALVMNP